MTKPFFITGCVRSGTTFLRDALRLHPDLASPEETHFYRWTEPFGTPPYTRTLLNNKVLIRHREIDGISEKAFAGMLDSSVSRADLYRRYMRRYIKINKPEAKTWFDKTPQNVYGAAMIARQMPKSRFIHIVRNPLDVIASLKVGKIMHIPQIVGACNYWIEALDIMQVIVKAYPKRVYQLRYEDLTASLPEELEKICQFLGLEMAPKTFAQVVSSPSRHDHSKLFTDQELEKIRKLCTPLAKKHGYKL